MAYRNSNSNNIVNPMKADEKIKYFLKTYFLLGDTDFKVTATGMRYLASKKNTRKIFA